MSLVYVFGTGHGPVHRHVSPADLDLPGGRAGRDAVSLDFDGDGRVDDALWDTDADGVVDRSVLDLDDDGRPERAFTDPSGRGVWDEPDVRTGPELRWTDVRGVRTTTPAAEDSDADGRLDAARVEADHTGGDELACDLDADGRAEQLLVDGDGDGVFERAYTSSADAGAPSARWDVLLADTDGDGAVDVLVGEGADGWVPP